jgi:hypothetical protein
MSKYILITSPSGELPYAAVHTTQDGARLAAQHDWDSLSDGNTLTWENVPEYGADYYAAGSYDDGVTYVTHAAGR